MPGTILWDRFEYDPRRAENASLRVADKDRDLLNDLLGSAYADGRLSREELDERADQVAAAKTLGDLPPLVSDLVAPSTSLAASSPGRPVATADHRAEAERRYRRYLQQALWAFLTPTLICWVVWSATMFMGFPWPVFVTIGTGLRFAQLATSKQTTIESIEHSLERRDRRRLEQRRRRELRRGQFPPEPREHG